MKEHPILMNGAMVRATLAGTKTQTRRVIKLPPAPAALGEWLASTIGGENGGRTAAGNEVPLQVVIWHTRTGETIGCPHGQPGDRLWVREAFAKTTVCQALGQEWTVYRECDNRTDYGGPWKPSIHMPRAASRILLQIVSVRVERLNDCSEADALAEGVAPNWIGPLDKGPNGRGGEGWPGDDYLHYTNGADGDPAYSARESFESLWESINGAGSWDANPWVWVIEFKRVAP
ncbi:hypothetical protein [Janthinobacterium sp. J1-1]|uniref:hypothetical protein n=1 Tax=Janthinobacterium sp. J1-1 TaxID=3065910 RepID=UPI002810F712|nr:hypothetical protein [Janthinobacterium sp. J1-1]